MSRRMSTRSWMLPATSTPVPQISPSPIAACRSPAASKRAGHEDRQVQRRALADQPRVHVAAVRSRRAAGHGGPGRRDADDADHRAHRHAGAGHSGGAALDRDQREGHALEAVAQDAEVSTHGHHALRRDVDPLDEHGQDVAGLRALDEHGSGRGVDVLPVDAARGGVWRLDLVAEAVGSKEHEALAGLDLCDRRGLCRQAEHALVSSHVDHGRPSFRSGWGLNRGRFYASPAPRRRARKSGDRRIAGDTNTRRSQDRGDVPGRRARVDGAEPQHRPVAHPVVVRCAKPSSASASARRLCSSWPAPRTANVTIPSCAGVTTCQRAVAGDEPLGLLGEADAVRDGVADALDAVDAEGQPQLERRGRAA